MKRHRHGIHPGALVPTAVGLALLAVTGPSPSLEARRVSEWSQPENLGPDVNSAFEDFAPHLSSDALTLYLTSNRPESLGGEDLWVARRASRHDAWGPAVNLGPAINTAANERSPALSRNGRLLFFATDRPGGSGDSTSGCRGAPTRRTISAGNHRSTSEPASTARLPMRARAFSNAERPRAFLSSFLAAPGQAALGTRYLRRLRARWMVWPAVAGCRSEQSPTRRDARGPADGLEIIIGSSRPGTLGGLDLWRSFRKSIDKPWSTPESLGETINTEFLEAFPALSFDGRTLLFQSTRPGGFGGSDLYMSSRW